MSNVEHLIENALTAMKVKPSDTHQAFVEEMNAMYNQQMLQAVSITQDELWAIAQYLIYTWLPTESYTEQDVRDAYTDGYSTGVEHGAGKPVKHGRWVVGGNCNHVPHRIKNPEKWVTYKCSECGYSNGRKQSHYCPNCGAQMDGGEAE